MFSVSVHVDKGWDCIEMNAAAWPSEVEKDQFKGKAKQQLSSPAKIVVSSSSSFNSRLDLCWYCRLLFCFFPPRWGTHLGMWRTWQKPYVCPQRILPTSLSACPKWTLCLRAWVGLDWKENAILFNWFKKIGVSSLLKIITRCWRKVVLFKTKISVLSLEATSSLLMWWELVSSGMMLMLLEQTHPPFRLGVPLPCQP